MVPGCLLSFFWGKLFGDVVRFVPLFTVLSSFSSGFGLWVLWFLLFFAGSWLLRFKLASGFSYGQPSGTE